VRALGSLNAVTQEGLAAVQRIFDILDEAPAIQNAPGARPLRVTKGEITLDRVSFAYGSDAPALKDISLHVPGGRTVALVGRSGAGKSTVFNLIPRFFEADSGRIAVDGQDIRSVTIASLRGAMALVSQDTVIFNDTVGANIAFGKLDATRAEIETAARAAAAHDFIMRLPHGYDTEVGDRGFKLSGGERQRLALARAVLKDAPILLLDEATSALDSESERLVQRSLEELSRGRTTLVIAHRLATVRRADMIAVLDRGQIVETGTHEELLAKEGLYTQLSKLQLLDDEKAAEPEAAAGE
ncbi:MAG: ABC transporter ATP-binding protein, partial [bacterium]